ncbi:hypothetical protein AB0P32_34320, partial [Streptomyces sp. NPDC085995]
MPEGTMAMAVHEHSQRSPILRFSFRADGTGPATAAASELDAHTVSARVLASLRILTGFVFLWAFLDKVF